MWQNAWWLMVLDQPVRLWHAYTLSAENEKQLGADKSKTRTQNILTCICSHNLIFLRRLCFFIFFFCWIPLVCFCISICVRVVRRVTGGENSNMRKYFGTLTKLTPDYFNRNKTSSISPVHTSRTVLSGASTLSLLLRSICLHNQTPHIPFANVTDEPVHVAPTIKSKEKQSQNAIK